MAETSNHPPGILSLLRRTATTFAGAMRNRAELLLLEWQEERARLAEVFVLAGVFMLLGIMALALLTGTIICLFPERLRIYAAGGLALLYAVGAAGVGFGLRGLLKRIPFPETLEQTRKDREWLESFK